MKIIHTSDWHLGGSWNGIDRTEELFKQVDCVCRIVRERRADVLLVAGDVFEGKKKERDKISKRLAEKLKDLIETGCHAILVPGNHDDRDHFAMMKTFLELESGKAKRIHIVEGYESLEIGGVQFVCLPYPDPEKLEAFGKFRSAEKIGKAERNKSLSDKFQEIKRSLEGLTNHSAADIKNQEKLVKQLEKETEKLEIEKNSKQQELGNARQARNLKNEREKIQAQQKSDAEAFEKAAQVKERYERYTELERVLFGFDKVWREKDEIERIVADLQANEQKILKLTNDLKANAEESAEAEIACEAAKLKLAALENDLKDAQSKRDNLKQKLADIERVEKLENQIEQASGLLKIAQDNVCRASERVAELESERKAKAAQKENLENLKQDYQSDLRVWSERLENRRKVVDEDECPLCGNELTRDEIRQKLLADFEAARVKVDELVNLQNETSRKLAETSVGLSALKKESETEREKQQLALQNQSSAKSKIETLQVQLQELPQIDCNQRAAILEDFKALQSSLPALGNKFAVARESLAQIEKQKRDAENSATRLEASLEDSKQNQKNLQTRRQNTEVDLEKANEQILPKWHGHSALNSKEELENLRQESVSLQSAEAEHRTLLEAEKRQSHLKGQMETLESQLQKIPETHRCEIAEVEVEFNETARKIKNQKRQLDEAEIFCRRMQADKSAYTEKSGEMKSVQKDLDMWKTLAKTLGKEGLETKIVREAQHKISENANKTLKALSNGNFQLELEDSGKEMKIFVRDFTTGEQRQIEFFSGGEKFLTAVSLAIAIGQSASGQNIANTLIVDEGFGALDDKNRVSMVKELIRLAEVFQNGRVIVVSHQDDVQESFADRYRLSKNEDGLTSVRLRANL